MELTLDKLLEVVSTHPDPLFIITESGTYKGVFGGGDRNYYHDGSGLVGSRFHDVMPVEKADWFLEQVKRAFREGPVLTVEYNLAGSEVEGVDTARGPAGELWFEGRIQPLAFPIDGERAVVWAARNITRRHELEARLRRMSETDELTGAYNRRKLLQELERMYRELRRYDRRTALLMIDLDDFKEVNDRYGHLVGDEVLRRVTRRLQENLREVDLLSRFGGDEFVVLLPDTGLDAARDAAERLRGAVGRGAVTHDGGRIPVSISVGIGVMEREDPDFEAILGRIDRALHQAKDSRRSRIVVADTG